MKTLIFFRHAKSDWSGDFEHDHDRPLSDRGRSAARLMGQFLGQSDLEPQLILTSSATRARQTVELASKAGAWSGKIRETPEIYEASVGTLQRLISEQDDAVDRLMLVGHNPSFELAVAIFTKGGATRMPTAAMAAITIPADDWRSAVSQGGTLKWLITPKLLKKGGFPAD